MPPSFANGQNAGRVHDRHPTSTHDKSWKRVKLEGSGHSSPVVKLDASKWYKVYDEWLVNGTRNEGVKAGSGWKRSVSHTVHVEASGEYSWGVEAGLKVLAGELKQTASAKVSLGGGWSRTAEESIESTSEITLKPCQKVYFYFYRTRKKASGNVQTWEHKITCDSSNRRPDQTGINYCVWKQFAGSAVGWGTHFKEHVERGNKVPCNFDNASPPVVNEPELPIVIPDPTATPVDIEGIEVVTEDASDTEQKEPTPAEPAGDLEGVNMN